MQSRRHRRASSAQISARPSCASAPARRAHSGDFRLLWPRIRVYDHADVHEGQPEIQAAMVKGVQ